MHSKQVSWYSMEYETTIYTSFPIQSMRRQFGNATRQFSPHFLTIKFRLLCEYLSRSLSGAQSTPTYSTRRHPLNQAAHYAIPREDRHDRFLEDRFKEAAYDKDA